MSTKFLSAFLVTVFLMSLIPSAIAEGIGQGIGNNTTVTNSTTENCTLKILNFTTNVVTGACPLKTNTVSNVSGNPVSYNWTWTDPNGTPIDKCDWYSKHNKTAAHTFRKAGLYTVTLTVKDAHGHIDVMKKINYINVTEKVSNCGTKGSNTATPIKSNDCKSVSKSDVAGKPTLVFTSDCIKTTVGKKVIFTAKVTGNPNKWVWDFGDKITSISGNGAGHTYTKPGTYTVTVKVTNCKGTTTFIAKDLIHVTKC